MTSGGQKLSLFADEFGLISGYEMNINKTQVLTFNYDHPSSIISMYNWNWDAESAKYLGVSLPRDLSRLYDINYSLLS